MGGGLNALSIDTFESGFTQRHEDAVRLRLRPGGGIRWAERSLKLCRLVIHSNLKEGVGAGVGIMNRYWISMPRSNFSAEHPDAADAYRIALAGRTSSMAKNGSHWMANLRAF